LVISTSSTDRQHPQLRPIKIRSWPGRLFALRLSASPGANVKMQRRSRLRRSVPPQRRQCPTTEVTDSRIFILRASYQNLGAQPVLILEVAAALGRFARFGSSRMATRFTFFTCDPACLEPRLWAAYSRPSTGATCGGSQPRYGARFRTPPHAHQPTSRAFQRKPIAGREFRPGHSRYRPQAHAHSHRGGSRHDTTCCSPPRAKCAKMGA
jgi:hypothetical protein